MNANSDMHRATLQRIARRAMEQRGLLTEPSREALAELDRIHGHEGLDVGDRLVVRLVRADVEQGFIDFERVRSSAQRDGAGLRR